jgi:outer membrane protein OmpA-like peptidoglycan-associated protein
MMKTLCFWSLLLFIAPFCGHAQPTGSVLPGYEPGFKAEYFADTVFGKKVHERVDNKIYLDYWMDMPAPGIYTDKFSIRWRGFLRAERTGTYHLYAVADDGIRVWIGGKLALNEWRLQKANKVLKGAIKLAKGKLYDVKAEYFNGKTACYLRLYWAYENEEPVPLDSRSIMTPTTAKAKLGPQIVAKAYIKQPDNPTTSAKKTAPAKDKTVSGKKIVAQRATILPEPERKKEPETDQPPITYEDLTIDKIVVLDNLQFEKSSYQLTANFSAVLDRLVNTLNKYKQLQIEIIGHTDNVGSAERNLLLAKQRAGVVKTYLVAHGVAEDRLQATGYGGGKPIASNELEEGRQKNRRVEFRVLQAPK